MGWATGVQFPLGAVMGFFSSSLCLDRLWGPPILLPSRYRGLLLLGVKRSGREADHLSPSSAEVKDVWSYTSTPQYVFMAWCLVNHRDNFAFTLGSRLEDQVCWRCRLIVLRNLLSCIIGENQIITGSGRLPSQDDTEETRRDFHTPNGIRSPSLLLIDFMLLWLQCMFMR
jgi:hypothetical protein